MGPRLLLLLLTAPPGFQPAAPAPAPTPFPQPAAPPQAAAAPAGDEQTLKAAFLADTPVALLEFFRLRAAPPGPGRLAELVRGLADPKAEVHGPAAAALVGAGPSAVPALRRAAHALDDPDAAGRARRCLHAIEGPAGAQFTAAAARLLAARRPAGAAEALLAYLPAAEDDAVTREVEAALAEVGRRGDALEPALLRALADPVAARRAAAAELVCRLGGPAGQAAVRPLLKDPRPVVRLRAALALADRNDADAVPVLIDLLADGPPAERKAAEEFLTGLAGDWALSTPQGSDAVAARLRREAWATWWRAADGAAVLDELRRRSLPDPDFERAAALVRRLDDGSADARESAAAELTALGPRAAPLLRRAARQGSPRAAALAARCLEDIERDAPARPLPSGAVRLLALRRPEGALEAVLAYLPTAEGDEAAEPLYDLLAALGVRDGRAAPALAAALGDRLAVRRAAAAVALCRGGAGDAMPAVRKLLADPDPEVRLRAGLALAARGEKEAVPALIALLPELPDEPAAEAEDFLYRLAGDDAPPAGAGEGRAGRERARDAWAAWWRAHGPSADLARAGPGSRPLQNLLAVEPSTPTAGAAGRVLELDPSGRVRWEIGGLSAPQDVQLLPGGRVLIAEQGANRVTERDRSGKIHWERSVPLPFTARRLPDGNTFIACRHQVVEVDREGKEVLSVTRPGYILAARKLRNGEVALVTNQGEYVRLDRTGKEVKAVRPPTAGPRVAFANAADLAPGDRMVLTRYAQSQVAEYGPDGKPVWEATVKTPAGVTRLPNGHTLVASYFSQSVTELDRQGKVIAERKNLPARPGRVYPN
jgi:HEAT repeat protein